VQLRSPMPKRLHPARVSAAVAAGDPPASAQYAHDDAWHDAQNIWLAKWSVRLLPEGPQRRRQWTKRKEEHARLVAASSKVAALTKKRVYARGKPKPPVVHEAVLAGPPRDKRPLPLSQPAYELAMGKYAIARDSRRKLPRRSKEEDAGRKASERALTAQLAATSLEGSAEAEKRLRSERERSQRRRDEQQRTALNFYEARLRERRRVEQLALLKANPGSRTCRAWKPGQTASPCVRTCKPVTVVQPRIRQRTVTQRVGSCQLSCTLIESLFSYDCTF
jgi:hypothetical protein